MITCPHCGGRGGFMSLAYRGENEACHTSWEECTLCDGDRAVSNELRKKYVEEHRPAEGVILREDRKRRGLTLGEEARRLGISVSELSRREVGRPDIAKLRGEA